MIRLNKFLSDRGICSRRRADELIQLGKVFVNGKKVIELGTKIDSEKDLVKVENKIIKGQEEKVYYILNKPAGYVTTAKDPYGRKKVTDLVPKNPRVYPVGRLDCDSEGLLILTNDGDFTNKMTHPRFEKEKEYAIVAKATKKSSILESLRDKFIKGIKLKEGIARADKISLLRQSGDKISFNIVVHQGWNRQIRRMCEAVGIEVLKLKRVRVGNIKLGDLKVGKWRAL